MTDNEMGVFITFIITAGVTIIVLARTIWARDRGVPAKELSNVDARLARIEQAVEAMSIEVERISEGQRFATRLLADRAGEGAGVPIDRQR